MFAAFSEAAQRARNTLRRSVLDTREGFTRRASGVAGSSAVTFCSGYARAVYAAGASGVGVGPHATREGVSMPENKLVGHNYTTPDLIAKVTGKAKYAEDYRVDGMLFAKLLLSPMPHARVVRIDTRAAAAMPGVKAILTVDDLPAVVEGANLGEGIIASTLSERGLTNEPLYVGDPVLAVAAVDEATATEAIEKIQIDFEPLPFVVDPLESLRPGSPNARTHGNVWVRPASAQ